MNKRYNEPMALELLAQLPDDQIDTSDIPGLDEAWLARAKLTPPRTKSNVSLRVPPEVVEFFKAKNPKGYTARMAAMLVAYVQAHRSASAQE